MLYLWTVLRVVLFEVLINRLSVVVAINSKAQTKRLDNENILIAPKKSFHSSLRQWSLDADGVCSGSDNSRAELQDENRIEQLRKQYENCTRVYGNLEITHIRKEHLYGSDPEQLFSFLDHIQQITGYLLIYSNEFENITLRNLEIIWGDVRHEDVAAVHIINNPYLKYINLPKLRSVERGLIVLSSNDYLCNWNQTVLFSEIAHESRLRFDVNNFGSCNASLECAPECNGHCWGSGADKCQIMYRSICSKKCASGMCYLKGNDSGCCDTSCAAGCYGPGKDECIACAHLEQDSQCVDQCNGLTSYDRTKMMTVNHPNPRYTYDRYCVERCPDETLIQGAHCVVHCREDYWHDPDKNTRVCEKCPNGICPKTCALNEPIDAINIKTLQNCTLIEGYVKLLRHTFEPHRKFVSVNPISTTNVPALTEEMLEALSSVKVVTEYVDIQAGEYTPRSLNFLRNLGTIEGRKLSDSHALSISNNVNLRQLGLRSLKRISNGRVYIGSNMNLCYVDTMNDSWPRIIEMTVEDGGSKSRIIRNRNPELCRNLSHICDTACNQSAGCWGHGPTMCLECERFDMGEKCANHCPKIGFYIEDGKKCKRCDNECVTCNGETALNCTQCKHVALQQGGGIECLAKCPATHYNDANTCLPCNAACYDFGCTGAGSNLGAGGCNKCLYAKRVCRTCDRYECLISYGKPKEVCMNNNLTNYYTTSGKAYVEQFECAECPRECLTCTGYGKSVHYHKCQCAHYLTRTSNSVDDYCTMECDRGNSYIVRNESADGIGECRACHKYCDPTSGCSGDTPFNCSKCAFAAIYTEQNVKVCIEACPTDKPYQTDDKLCQSLDPIAVREKTKRTTVIVGVLGAAMIVFIVTVLIWKCYKYKRQYKKEVEMNLPVLPECEPMDPNAKPNMSRLCLISSEHLSKTSRPLGKGAFGIVYAGYWWPNGKEGHEKVVVAIKVVQDSSGMAQREMLAEAGIMASMHHEHLLRLVGVCLHDGIQLVTPLRPLGNLRDFLIKHRQKLGARDLLLYCYQIASAMEYLYKNRLVHRDLAARNVLVKRTNHVEVTDFGLAKMLERGKSEIVVGGKVAVKWLALESLLYRCYTHCTDVWAFGVTCWEVLTFGQTPYQTIAPDNIRSHLEAGNRLEQPNNCTQDVYQTLVQCWLPNPESRPNFVLLKEKFKQFCSCPDIYVLDPHHPRQIEALNCGDQHELINELLEDNDFTDPLEYFDRHIDHMITNTTLIPNTPTSPTWSTNNNDNNYNNRTDDNNTKDSTLSPCGNTFLTRRDQRLVSTDSQRYQSEPIPGRRQEIGMDEGNYLVPTTKQSPALLYTPIVVLENGETELMKSSEYCNDKAGTYYYNEFKEPDMEQKKAMSSDCDILENKSYFESETTL